MSQSQLVITIMAAGEGKRMNSDIPKVLHNFNNKPILIRIIEESFKLNPYKIVVITGKYNDMIQDTLKKQLDILILNKIEFIKQEIPSGTGDAIKSTLNNYTEKDNVLILNGDMPLVSYNLLKKFIDYNNESDINAQLLVAELDNPFGYGRILYNSNNEFIGIKEQKDCSDEEKNIKIVNVGIYYFSSFILKNYIPLIDNNNSQKEYYLTDIIKIIRNNSDTSINIYLIENNLKYQIMGVNTKKELEDLELLYNENIVI